MRDHGNRLHQLPATSSLAPGVSAGSGKQVSTWKPSCRSANSRSNC